MIRSEKLLKILTDIEAYKGEEAIWLARPLFECNISKHKDHIECIGSYHFLKEFRDRKTREHLSHEKVIEFLKHQFKILDKNGNILAVGWSSCKGSLAPFNDFFKYILKDAEAIQYFQCKTMVITGFTVAFFD